MSCAFEKFVAEACDLVPGESQPSGQFLDAYRAWANENAAPTLLMRDRDLVRIFEGHGLFWKRTSSGGVWSGFRLKPEVAERFRL